MWVSRTSTGPRECRSRAALSSSGSASLTAAPHHSPTGPARQTTLPDGVHRSPAFAPGRVNLIGEHTDYNEGLALPFAIEQGITVRASAIPASRIEAVALDLRSE